LLATRAAADTHGKVRSSSLRVFDGSGKQVSLFEVTLQLTKFWISSMVFQGGVEHVPETP
jgi:hypothetical protein